MITAATSIVITKPTIRPISLFGSFERTPSFVVSSLTDAAVVTFTADEVILVDVTGIVAAVVFGSLPIVVGTAVVAVCDVTGDNDTVEEGDVDASLINCVAFSSKVVVGQKVVLVLFNGTAEEVSPVVVALATITSNGYKWQRESNHLASVDVAKLTHTRD